jgi:hypothetical protein
VPAEPKTDDVDSDEENTKPPAQDAPEASMASTAAPVEPSESDEEVTESKTDEN